MRLRHDAGYVACAIANQAREIARMLLAAISEKTAQTFPSDENDVYSYFRNVLRLGAYEILYTEIPGPVAIDESEPPNGRTVPSS